MKVLCICNGGNVRSVAVAQAIKELNGKYYKIKDKPGYLKYEAIAIGKNFTSPETMELLLDWSDITVDVSDNGSCFFGKDVWKNPRHPELIDIAKSIAEVIKYD